MLRLSEAIRLDVETTVRSNISHALILDVYAAAEEIRSKHGEAAMALDDIAASIARLAVQCGCAIKFGKDQAGRPTHQAA